MTDFRLAIVKGLVERGDGMTYFGSLMGFGGHRMACHDAGWIDADGKLTASGREAYARYNLSSLPQSGRAYMWDWSKIPRGQGEE